jgi:hypothetical protein
MSDWNAQLFIANEPRPATPQPDEGGYYGYHAKWAALTDAVSLQQPCVLSAGQQVCGNLRALPGDHWQCAGYEFSIEDIEWLWVTPHGTLMVELSRWIELSAKDYD